MTDQAQQDLDDMQRLKSGDDLALNDLMQRWKEPLISFCIRYTGNVTDARDIAQDTFVRVYSNRKKYQPAGQFSSWMFAIAVNLCRMRARWQSRHPEVLEADQGDTPHPPAVDPTNPALETDRNQLAADLDAAVQQLPHDLRSVFILYEINGQSYRDIAKVLACSEKAVERRLARARKKLRALLEKRWGESEP